MAKGTIVALPKQRRYGGGMSTTALEMHVRQGAEQVELQRLTVALDNLRLALSEIDRSLIDRGSRPRWVITELSQHDQIMQVKVTAAPTPRRSSASLLEPVDALVSGVAHLQREPELPEYYTKRTVERLLKIGEPGRGIQEVSLATVNGKVGRHIPVSEPVLRHARSAITGKQRSLGSVAGYLDTMSARHIKGKGLLRVSLFDPLTRRSVIGELPADKAAEVHDHFWRTRVLARGQVTRNDRGQTISISIEHLEQLPGEPDQRAPLEEILGADPDWLGGQNVDEYLREARRA
ncbi:hypothetical protein [Actinomadura litoris]|uniref:hypothetical protein n=1 Tax=Actinomadura litoris TaxID=2678616 RepID=UPI001FA6DE23|nr:hypothetical protein [Actinomadura litoris]